jgi:hypothetical protein
MMFFKRNAPTVVDYDKTKSELLRLGWLVEIYDVESNKSIYDITNLGYQYYFAICMKVGRAQMFSGPTLAEGQTTAYIDDDIDLTEEGYLVDGIDCEKLTPKAAEYLYVLTDLHGKEITIKNQNAKTVKSGSANKVDKYTSMFMRGMKKLSESAQDYDKTSTTSTRNAWGKKKKSSSRKRTSASKRTSKQQKRKSKSKKKRKKSTDTTKSEFSGGFDFKGIGDKMM